MHTRICKPLLSNSFFLFGPRGVGKTWLLRYMFDSESIPIIYINLLDEQKYLELTIHPENLKKYINDSSDKQWIVIDEVQRVPSLLNVVHDILEDPKTHNKVLFALTGSSARRLKRGSANLLASRALVYNLYPFSVFELDQNWSLQKVLRWGSLPRVVNAEDDNLRKEILFSYVTTYLKEEIKEEQLVRQIEPFARFLEAAAQSNGTIINYSNVARDAKVDPKAVSRYFEILEDTLIGFFLAPYSKSTRQRAFLRAKFYFFDLGVASVLSNSLKEVLEPRTYGWGRAFEHLVILEAIKLNNYTRSLYNLSYLRTKDDAEIDLIIEKSKSEVFTIEIKSGDSVTEIEVRKLKAISSSVTNSKPMFLYDGMYEQTIEGVSIMPWKEGLKRIFYG